MGASTPVSQSGFPMVLDASSCREGMYSVLRHSMKIGCTKFLAHVSSAAMAMKEGLFLAHQMGCNRVLA
jgi:hypothetical protein